VKKLLRLKSYNAIKSLIAGSQWQSESSAKAMTLLSMLIDLEIDQNEGAFLTQLRARKRGRPSDLETEFKVFLVDKISS
jgi:hypothetical protein